MRELEVYSKTEDFVANDVAISLQGELKKVATGSYYHASIDTYAKKLYIKGRSNPDAPEPTQLKRVLTIFFLHLQMSTSRDKRYDSFNIIEVMRGTSEPINEAKRKILRYKIFLLEPSDTKDYFITSDNPGFTWVDKQVRNTNFERFSFIGFPINSKHLVMFMGNSMQSDLEVIRPINYRKIDRKQVYTLNCFTTVNSFKFVYCESKKYLSEFVTQFIQK